MDLTEQLRALGDVVAGTPGAVVAVGGRTQFEVGGGVPATATEVRAPTGVVRFDPAELTVTVGAGITLAELDAALAEAGQEVVLDARAPGATVGGVLAAGLSGPRRLRIGPVRDRVLEVRFVTADGRVVKAGGPTVKNVSGYDLPRLLVGSLGTLGVIGQVTLRAQARPTRALWAVTEGEPFGVRRALYLPSCIAWDGTCTYVLLEGHPADVDAEVARAGLAATGDGPPWPDGPHRGRISVRPRALTALAPALAATGCRWLAEAGVGTVHVAADTLEPLARARKAAHAHGGWLLREGGGQGLDPFGAPLPNLQLLRRIKAAFDPDGKLAPGRLPFGPQA